MRVPQAAANAVLLLAAAGLLALVLAACGGGGSSPADTGTRTQVSDADAVLSPVPPGGTGGGAPPPGPPGPTIGRGDTTPAPSPDPPDPTIGPGDTTSAPSPAQPVPAPGPPVSVGSRPAGAAFSDTAQSRGTASFATATTTGQSAGQLVTYIQYLIDSDGLGTFKSPPSVHLTDDTTPEFRALARQAVQTLNAALPSGFQIAIGADAPASSTSDTVPLGRIYVRLTASNQQWERYAPSDAYGVTWHTGLVSDDNINWDVRRAMVWLTSQFGERHLYTILLHELIHALAVFDHPTPAVAPGSLMYGSVSRIAIIDPRAPLPDIDAHLLRVAYGHLSPGTLPETFTVSDLGPWDDEFHLRGEIADAGIAFGASTQNGIGDAWATGPGPGSSLYANRHSLGATATWNGALVGFTREDHTVTGDAAITVTLASRTGTTAFTGLESFGDRAAPGAAGTGTRWGDGRLDYAIRVDGNAFRETAASADVGFLEGSFTGTGHEGAVGTLRRPDLTAAFGATR